MGRVLITGITGMVGSHMADFFLKEFPEMEIYGTKRWRSSTTNIQHLPNSVKLMNCDLLDQSACTELISAIKPDYIFHLAAQSYVLDSFRHPMVNLTQNPAMQLNIFEAVRAAKIDPVIQVALSSEEYGHVNQDELPITENNELRPLSPYAVSKVAQDMLAYQYFRSYGLRTIRTRAFNHEGPRRGEVFVTSNFAKQIADIEAGLKPPVLGVGNLDARRDWTDVRDMVRAYWLAANHCDPGDVYVIASGVTRTIGSMLEFLLLQTEQKIEVVTDPERLRPSDVEVLLGDPAKFKKATGWEAEIPYEQTMIDVLNYWRQLVNDGQRNRMAALSSNPRLDQTTAAR